MKKYFFILFCLPVFALAQKTHTVGPKESLFSIGREYNVHPRELAQYNNIPFENGLTIGQVIKIPTKTTMAPLPKETTSTEVVKTAVKQDVPKTVEKEPIATETKKASPALTPIYHKVQKKENLYQISLKYNKVPVEDLKKWNKLSADGLKEGMDLIVGYTSNLPVQPVDKKVVKDSVKIIAEKTEKTVDKKETTQTNTIVVKSEQKSPVVTEVITEVKTPPSQNSPLKNSGFGGGYFKTVFSTQTNSLSLNESGVAGIFKSTSGWEDGKYYCLHNTAPAGTILKITNTSNQKVIYAKVLDVIPDLKQNKDILIRISNAAAQELGATNDTFTVTLER